MLPSLIGSIECISVSCGGGQMPPNACVRMHLTSNIQSDGDQRIATVSTVSHEVILSDPLRLRFSYANVWWSSGRQCEGSTMQYFSSWKADISVEQTFKVNTKRPLSWSILWNEQILTACTHFHARALKHSWHKHRQTHINTHSHCIVHAQHWRRKKDATKKVNWGRKNVSGLTFLTNGFQWLTSPLHHFHQALIKYSWILQSLHC